MLDYLISKEDVEIDKDTQKRILEVSKFEEKDQEHIFSVIDAFIAKRKIQSIMLRKSLDLSRLDLFVKFTMFYTTPDACFSNNYEI